MLEISLISTVLNTFISLAMRIVDKGPLMCAVCSLFLKEQMLTFLNKNSVGYELEGKRTTNRLAPSAGALSRR